MNKRTIYITILTNVRKGDDQVKCRLAEARRGQTRSRRPQEMA